MKFDPTKPVQTRDGRKARIICTDREQVGYPILALVGDYDEEIVACDTNGRACGVKHDSFLINTPRKATVEIAVPVFQDMDGNLRTFTAKERSLHNCHRIGEQRITIELDESKLERE